MTDDFRLRVRLWARWGGWWWPPSLRPTRNEVWEHLRREADKHPVKVHVSDRPSRD